ncbi:MAG: hypothetical protein HQ483_21490 [Rhodospirillales bacterium]|nr:hypothetical protein [Rhodospirillales bacterium]
MIDPVRQLDIISAMIDEARSAIRDGATIDLIEIQGLVQEVCTAIQQDPPADGGAAHEKILAMISNLNLLADDLKQQQTDAGAEVIRRAVRKSYTKGQDN